MSKYICLDTYGSALQFTGSGRSVQCAKADASQFDTEFEAGSALAIANEKDGTVETAPPVCERVGISFPAWVSETGQGFLLGATHAATPCGCRVIGNGTLTHPLAIQFCAKHGGAQ